MPVAFVSTPGQVIALPMPNDAPMPMAMTGWAGPAFKAILTEFAVQVRDNFQTIHTLSDLIYVYSFGRAISQMRVAGVAFIADCSGDPTTGIEYVQNYYNTYSASTYPAPVTVVLGTTGAAIHTGFLVGLDAQLSRPEARLGQFALQFLTLPRRTSS